MTASNITRAQVNVYAAGGGGVNIVADMESLRNQSDVGFASMVPCYIDTSRSNLHNKKLPEEAIYLFNDIDGSGKVRSANYEAISKNVLGILQKFKPTMFNVVVHTASGG
jgi:hypothetical protein